MKSRVLYRLPYADRYLEVQAQRDDKLLGSIDEIGREAGFVVAPFCPSKDCPIVLVPAEAAIERPLPPAEHQEPSASPEAKKQPAAGPSKSEEASTSQLPVLDGSVAEQTAYPFATFHAAVASGSFDKLVLARQKQIETTTSPHAAFFDACHRYPRLMVMLVESPTVGTWLAATPEILLTGDGRSWRTMALAGTMPFREGYQEWSPKNRHEQHVVEDYIERTVSLFATDIVKDGPHTQRAGALVHLCTDFRFRLATGSTIGQLLARLHPTPAVCGLPKDEARRFILQNEPLPRQYYSGFMGPISLKTIPAPAGHSAKPASPPPAPAVPFKATTAPTAPAGPVASELPVLGGSVAESHLYVALRCAKFLPQEAPSGPAPLRATLFAGGGIMPGSTLPSEWSETEEKMKTIASVL